MPPRISSLPQNQERHALQALLSGNWRPETALYPTRKTTLAKMTEKAWIERRRSAQLEYKITDAGRVAFRAQLP